MHFGVGYHGISKVDPGRKMHVCINSALFLHLHATFAGLLLDSPCGSQSFSCQFMFAVPALFSHTERFFSALVKKNYA